jgi:hypothetical protein
MKMLNEKKPFWTRWRDAITGLFVKKTDALGNPTTTVGETVKRAPRKPRVKKVV